VVAQFVAVADRLLELERLFLFEPFRQRARGNGPRRIIRRVPILGGDAFVSYPHRAAHAVDELRERAHVPRWLVLRWSVLDVEELHRAVVREQPDVDLLEKIWPVVHGSATCALPEREHGVRERTMTGGSVPGCVSRHE